MGKRVRIRKFRVKIQKEAIDELDSLFAYIHRDSPVRARSFLKGLKERIMSLEKFPLRGCRARILESSGPMNEIRFLEYYGHLIFYTVEKDKVFVLHLSNPGQDWWFLFQS